MTDPLKTYRGVNCETDVGTSGFTNYFNNSPNPLAVFRDFPEAIIVDGTDDWSASPVRRPAAMAHDARIEPLAWFHSGISGITKSGVVLSREGYRELNNHCLRTFGLMLNEAPGVTVCRNDCSDLGPVRDDNLRCNDGGTLCPRHGPAKLG